MDPITGLIFLGATIAVAGTKAYGAKKQSDEIKAARNEAYGIAMQNREDQLNQQNINNQFAKKELGLRDQSLKFQDKMFNEYKKDKQQEVDQFQNLQSNQFLTGAAKKMFNPDDSLTLRKQQLQRFL